MYCDNCKKHVPDGKFCVNCGHEINQKKSIITGINVFQITMTVLLIVWLVLYVGISFVIVYNKTGKGGELFDYSIMAPIFVLMFNFVYFPLFIVINYLIISDNKGNNTKRDIKKIVSIILNSCMILFFSLQLFSKYSFDIEVVLYNVPVFVFLIISLLNTIIKIKIQKMQKV